MNYRTIAYQVLCFGIIFLSAILVNAQSDDHDLWFEQVINTGAYNMGVIQDRDGFLWFTTTGGLIRFDGYEQFAFTEGPKGLSSNFVPSVFEDSEGLMWIVTMSGLDLYNKEDGSITHFQPDKEKPGSIGSNSFRWAPRLITEDQDGGIWFGSREGVFRYDKKEKIFTPFKHDPEDINTIGDNDIWNIMAGRDGKIWIGTLKGLDVYDPGTDSFLHYRHDADRKNSLGKGIVYAVHQDSDGEIWVGTSEGGLNRLQTTDGTFTVFTHDPEDETSIINNQVYSITEDHSGNLWLGRTFSNGVGLEKYNLKTQKFKTYTHNPKLAGTLSSNIIATCFVDHSNTLWVPNKDGSVDKVDRSSHRFDLYAVEPDIPATIGFTGLMSVYEDSRKDIWLSGQNGLSRLDHKTGQWKTYKVDVNNPQALWNLYAFSVIEDSEGDFWVATNDGYLNLFDRDKGIVKKRYLNPYVQHTASQIIEDKAIPGLFWFGVEASGLFSFNKKTGAFTQFKSDSGNPQALGNDYVYTLFQSEDNIIWIPTIDGLYRFDPGSGIFSSYKHDPENPKSISSNVINDIFVDSRKVFWVSTNRGLNRFDPVAGTFTLFNEKNGFITPVIRTIEEDAAGYLWLGSNKGLFTFDPEREKIIRHYTVADGLQGDSFNYNGGSALKTRDGKLWFVGLGGANSFYPGKIQHNTEPPNIYLSRLSQGGEALVPRLKVHTTKDIYLNWRQNYFEFEFVGLNFSQAQKNQYKYKLEGWDSDWFFAGKKRFGRYSGLDRGDYVLKIMAANNDGVWCEAQSVLTVHVNGPFWQRDLFYVALVVVFAGLFFVFYVLRIRQLRDHQNRLKKLVNERTREYRIINENLQKEIAGRQKMEEELFHSRKLDSIGVLAGGIAHDFNNLMTAILGNINLAQMKSEFAESKELEIAIQAVHRAKILTDKFITFSSGGNPVKQLFDIETVTRSALELALSGSNVQAEVSVVPDIWRGNIDQNHISQALHNIIENSKQSMEHGGTLRVTFTTLIQDKESGLNELPIVDGSYVVIEFHDEGTGISPEHLSKVFDPYFTTVAMGAQKGKGLGLTIAYSIIKKHGGYTFIDSVVDKGTRVRVLLPAISDKTADEGNTAVNRPVAAERQKILLMDDELMIRDIGKLMLGSMGHEVTLASDGETAVKEYKNAFAAGKPFDIIILDLTIPGGMGGKDVAKKLKQFDPDVRAIVSSGYADDPVVANFKEYGFSATLSKPYDMAGLKATLDAIA